MAAARFHHEKLIDILGKNHGDEIDKEAKCEQAGVCWKPFQSVLPDSYLKDFEDFKLLEGCAAYLPLTVCDWFDLTSDARSNVNKGDHDMIILKPVGEAYSVHGNVLTTGELRSLNIL